MSRHARHHWGHSRGHSWGHSWHHSWVHRWHSRRHSSRCHGRVWVLIGPSRVIARRWDRSCRVRSMHRGRHTWGVTCSNQSMLCPRQGANCCYIDNVKLLQDLLIKKSNQSKIYSNEVTVLKYLPDTREKDRWQHTIGGHVRGRVGIAWHHSRTTVPSMMMASHHGWPSSSSSTTSPGLVLAQLNL